MTWTDLIVACAAVIAVTIVPGLVLAALLGLRGLAAWATAAPFGVTVVSTATLLAPLIGLGWSLLPVALVTAVFAAVIITVRSITPRGWRRPGDVVSGDGRFWTIGVLTAAAVVIAIQIASVIGRPDNISQTFDNIFHLNAIRYAVDNANASPLFVGTLTSVSGGQWFYPTAWHAVAALSVDLTGVSVPVAANAMALAFSIVVWPAGALWLASSLFGRSPGVLVGAGLAIIGSAAFPLLMIDYGVLYPMHMGFALLPASIALLLRAFRIVRLDEVPQSLTTVAVLGVLPGLAITHPGALAAWLVLATVAVVFAAVRAFRRGTPVRRVMTGAIVLAYFSAAAAVWWVLRPPVDARTWGPEMTAAQALGEVVFVSPYRAPLAIFLAAVTAVGIVTAVRRRGEPALFAVSSFAVLGALYVVVASLPYPELRDLLTGSWYNNLPRLAALLPIAVAPLAGAGLNALAAVASRRLPSARVRPTARAVTTAALIVAAVVVTLFPMRAPLSDAAITYALTEDSPLVSTDEMTLMKRLDSEVEPDAVIAGSPWTGAGLAYAISGRRVLQPHTLMEVTDDMVEINNDLNQARPGAPVCTAIADTGVRYVLDFGTREVHGGSHPYPGFRALVASRAAKLVDSVGQAKLYRVTGCDS